MKIGATGEFPRGKIRDDDEGELAIAIAADPATNTVIINFGKPVIWVGFGPEEAMGLAAMILDKVKALKEKRT